MLTTLTSYGKVPAVRQAELIRGLALPVATDPFFDPDVRALIERIQKKG